ncbi:MAG: DUF1778 domain-containing protein [Leptospiraceae bacterium]|jgi:uncharacterized protein (DUF1778 family)|nr:DUF1778 domain-containing protein [Leptospiraceae bacterium]MBK7057270.1 DUF1778 domain-containing protein [Leptospiraceae bacterium]MBK9502685.1 DUF1778 domain-containing protein [Leptospiraceae bacterium]MBP9165225.1 DUF1778 domain-containing protein [Leptospiraceae bacterium]HRG49111.1 DUF1778 domain-containing protein [Leptospiraceae bacterium]
MARTANLNPKEERIELRVSNEQKSIIEKAANINGLSLSSYMLSQALQSARIDIENSELIKLTNKDRDLFVNSIEKKYNPNRALKQAMKRGY